MMKRQKNERHEILNDDKFEKEGEQLEGHRIGFSTNIQSHVNLKDEVVLKPPKTSLCIGVTKFTGQILLANVQI
jgi:hypothetical protein